MQTGIDSQSNRQTGNSQVKKGQTVREGEREIDREIGRQTEKEDKTDRKGRQDGQTDKLAFFLCSTVEDHHTVFRWKAISTAIISY